MTRHAVQTAPHRAVKHAAGLSKARATREGEPRGLLSRMLERRVRGGEEGAAVPRGSPPPRRHGVNRAEKRAEYESATVRAAERNGAAATAATAAAMEERVDESRVAGGSNRPRRMGTAARLGPRPLTAKRQTMIKGRVSRTGRRTRMQAVERLRRKARRSPAAADWVMRRGEATAARIGERAIAKKRSGKGWGARVARSSAAWLVIYGDNRSAN